MPPQPRRKKACEGQGTRRYERPDKGARSLRGVSYEDAIGAHARSDPLRETRGRSREGAHHAAETIADLTQSGSFARCSRSAGAAMEFDFGRLRRLLL